MQRADRECNLIQINKMDWVYALGLAPSETEEVLDIVVVQPKEPVKAEQEAKEKRTKEYKWENDKVEALINRWAAIPITL